MSEFTPTFSLIQSIAQGVQTTVTFTAPITFIVGEIVSFRISPPSGMRELNNVHATVMAATSNSITVNIDSRNFTPFVFAPENVLVFPAMAVPGGSGITPSAIPPQTTIADAFDNVPPN